MLALIIGSEVLGVLVNNWTDKLHIQIIIIVFFFYPVGKKLTTWHLRCCGAGNVHYELSGLMSASLIYKFN